MKKDFDTRNESKKRIHRTPKEEIATVYINPKEIWYATVGCNVGTEQDGKGEFKRPVLVVRKIGSVFFCVPLTTKGKESRYYHALTSAKLPYDSALILSQGRTLDKRRFTQRIGEVNAQEFGVIKKLLKDMYLGEVS